MEVQEIKGQMLCLAVSASVWPTTDLQTAPFVQGFHWTLFRRRFIAEIGVFGNRFWRTRVNLSKSILREAAFLTFLGIGAAMGVVLFVGPTAGVNTHDQGQELGLGIRLGDRLIQSHSALNVPALLLFVSGSCPACFNHARAFKELLSTLAIRRIHFRVIVPTRDDVPLFQDFLGLSEEKIVVRSPKAFGVGATPTILHIAKEGFVAGRWIGLRGYRGLEYLALQHQKLSRLTRLSFDNNSHCPTQAGDAKSVLCLDLRPKQVLRSTRREGFVSIPIAEFGVRMPAMMEGKSKLVIETQSVSSELAMIAVLKALDMDAGSITVLNLAAGPWRPGIDFTAP